MRRPLLFAWLLLAFGCSGRTTSEPGELPPPAGEGDGDGAGPALPGPIVVDQLPSCAGLLEDASFASLGLDGQRLGRVYDVWGLSDDDIHVALGVETATWPNSSTLAAIAHWDGQKWSLSRLPPVRSVFALSGVGQGDLRVATDAERGTVVRRLLGRSPEWFIESYNDWNISDLAMTPELDGFMTANDPSGGLSGNVYRYVDGWKLVELPFVGERYRLRSLRVHDAQHVYAFGLLTGARMGQGLIGRFNGTNWSLTELPSGCGFAVQDLAVAGDATYTLGRAADGERARKICRATRDLSSFAAIGELVYEGDSQALVSTAGQTLAAIWANYMAKDHPTVIATLRAEGITSACTLRPGLGQFVGWSAPQSRNVHIFAGETAGGATGGPGKHLIKRLAP
ncbi:MAG: hypothetical protein ABW133_17820 [Polyangiaceae bacterium]